MKIFNIFKRWNYIVSLAFLSTNLFAFLLYKDYMLDKIFVSIYEINFIILFLYYLYCIFLESEFESHYFKVTQLYLQKYLFLVSLMANLASGIDSFLYFCFPYSYIRFKLACNFYRNEFNSLNKCELYNVNKDIFPYKFICSYNPQIDEFPRELRNLGNFYPVAKCLDYESLIYNNKIIEEFKTKYIGENIYYCDLKYQPQEYYSIDKNKCNKNILLPKFLIIIYIYLSVKHFVLINTYYKYIKSNIIIDFIITNDSYY